MNVCSRIMPFHCAVCGVDGSPEAAEAARQAARLVAANAKMLLVGVVDPWRVILDLRGRDPQVVSATEREHAEANLDQAAAAIPAGIRLEKRVLEGQPGPTLIEEALREGADLLVVGSHGRSRRRGILLGSVATLAAHQGPCPVLIARPTDTSAFPTGMVVGVDGSDEGWQAWRVAGNIADRRGVAARAIIASDAGDTTVATVRERLPGVQLLEGQAAHVLAEAVSPGDLLALGARGLGGVLALGSVSERVAHHAACSVLIVRSSPSHQVTGPVAIVAEVMTAPPLVIGEDATLEEAAHLMLSHASDAVVVVDADGAVSGILSEAELRRHACDLPPAGGLLDRRHPIAEALRTVAGRERPRATRRRSP